MSNHDQHPLTTAFLPKYLNDVVTPFLEINQNYNPLISGLQIDSRNVQKGDLFLAFPGVHTDGRKYIENAVSQGAIAVLSEALEGFPAMRLVKGPGAEVPVYYIADLAQHVGYFAANYYSHPSKHLRVVGITGTNGKTTCSHLVAEALYLLGERSGLIGTLGSGLWGTLVETKNTTPDPVSLQRQLAEMRSKNVNFVIMEVSSHGLAQGRVNGICFETAALTNITRDHLDYHESMSHYIQTKERLFSWPDLNNAIFNMDDSIAHSMSGRVNQQADVNVFGIGSTLSLQTYAGIKILDSVISDEKITIKFTSAWGEGEIINSHLYGAYNVSNLAMALVILLLLDVPLANAAAVLAQVHGVPGRMNKMGGGNNPLVFIDYAHTPDGLLNAIKSARTYCKNRLICVFGCGGDRDQGKRSQMGRVAWECADLLIVTADNPRSESVEKICQQIISDIPSQENTHVILDRADAIAYAINVAEKNDVVLIAGKGAENYQEIAGVRRPFSDYHVAEAQLARRAA